MTWIEKLKNLLSLNNEKTSKQKPVAWSTMATFLEDLEKVGDNYPELYDTDVRERLFVLIDDTVLKRRKAVKVPEDLGMSSEEANAELRKVLEENITRINEIFDIFELNSEEKRKISFWNLDLHTENGSRVDEFFGSP